jgi:hypothetical protein
MRAGAQWCARRTSSSTDPRGATWNHHRCGHVRTRHARIGNGLGTARRVASDRHCTASRYLHHAGLYSLDDGLRFGDLSLQSDQRGGYYRIDYSAARLTWGLGIDAYDTNLDKVPDRAAYRNYNLSGNASYRFDARNTVGGSATWWERKVTNGEAVPFQGDNLSWNASAYYDTRFDFGRSRFSATIHRNEELVKDAAKATGEEFNWEHDWITGKYESNKPEFVTTIGFAREKNGDETTTRPTAGLNVRLYPIPYLVIGGNLRYTGTSTNLSTTRGVAGSVFAEWDVARGIKAGVTGNFNEAKVDVSGAQPVVTRSNDRFFGVFLRIEDTFGTPYAAAGLKFAGSPGAGRIYGIVFADNNRDGEQQSDELGLPNVEVLIDGRYRVLTDRTGRFEFAMVSAGPHDIALRLETIPLPYGPARERPTRIEVPLRGEIKVAIPVVRVGGAEGED